MGDELKTVHIHNSVDFSDIQEGELFPVQAGRDAYRKLEEKLADKDRQIELMLSQLPGGMMICRRDEVYSAKWISDNCAVSWAMWGLRNSASVLKTAAGALYCRKITAV